MGAAAVTYREMSCAIPETRTGALALPSCRSSIPAIPETIERSSSPAPFKLTDKRTLLRNSRSVNSLLVKCKREFLMADQNVVHPRFSRLPEKRSWKQILIGTYKSLSEDRVLAV